MKSLLSIFTFICFLIFTNFQCDEEFCDTPARVASLSVDLTPEKAIYVIGDTIELQTEIGTILPIQNSNELLDIKNGICRLDLFIMKLGDDPDSLKGYADFDILNISGDLNQDDIEDKVRKRYQGTIHFDCHSLGCGFKIGLVPKARGKYCIALYIGNVNIQDTSFCPAHNNLYDNVFNVSFYHREIFQELHIHYPIRLPTMYSSGGSWDVIENDGAYAFKVE